MFRRLRALIVGGSSVVFLVGCAVDREATRDQIIGLLEEAGISADADCIDDVFDNYTDEVLLAAEAAMEDGEESAVVGEIAARIHAECTVAAPAPSP